MYGDKHMWEGDSRVLTVISWGIFMLRKITTHELFSFYITSYFLDIRQFLMFLPIKNLKMYAWASENYVENTDIFMSQSQLRMLVYV